MNLGMFDNIDGLILRERENGLRSQELFPEERRLPNGSNMQAFPAKTPLAMAYVPFQTWSTVKNADAALASGTLFPDLDLPFTEGGKIV